MWTCGGKWKLLERTPMWPKIAVIIAVFVAGVILGSRGCAPDPVTRETTRWERDTVSVHDTTRLIRFERTVVPYLGGEMVNNPDTAHPCGSYAFTTFLPWHNGEFSGADTLSFSSEECGAAIRNLVLGRSPVPVRERTTYISRVSGSAEVVTLEANPDLFQVWGGVEYDVLPHLLPANAPHWQVYASAGLFFRNIQFTASPAISPAGLRLNLGAKTRFF